MAMKIYQVVKTSVTDCSNPRVEVFNFANINDAKAKFEEVVNDFEYDEEEYEVTLSDDDFECYLAEDALMDYGRVQLVENELK